MYNILVETKILRKKHTYLRNVGTIYKIIKETKIKIESEKLLRKSLKCINSKEEDKML